MIRNPVLPGFHPDPSVVRVGNDCFIATSTFEWFPGIRLHHTRDFRSYRLVGHALTRPSQIDLVGIPDSGGVWAPNLTHDGQRFLLVYSFVTARAAFPLIAVSNFLVTADNVEGPWSDPVFLNGTGWDPSLFHDGSGRTWLLNMRLDHRAGHPATAGVVMQELLAGSQRLSGPIHNLFPGTALGCTEAPQLFTRGGWFYLATAEGGTSWNHAVTVARSRDLLGP